MPTVRIIGPGRAGRSLAAALAGVGSWDVLPLLGRHDDVAGAASGCDLLVVAVPDASVATVAATVAPVPATVVAHLAGSLTLDALAPHTRRASLHPLTALADPVRGVRRLTGGAWFAVAGDPLVRDVAVALGGRIVEIPDNPKARAIYHAAACAAANHLVALMGSVERMAAAVGVPLDAYLDLAWGALDDVAAVGPAAALTGPVARRDHATVARHRAAIPSGELATYDALTSAAETLRGADTRIGDGQGHRGRTPCN